ncbi:MAG: hypothetical protein LBV37_01580 [Mycoplasmataceae bacterium]|nr:hypothetical protein [Mycoplasmataceae bacterium]
MHHASTLSLLSSSSQTEKIVYLVIGIVSVLTAAFMSWLTWYFASHKYSQNLLDSFGWFKKWICKNRMTICMMVAILLLFLGVVFIYQGITGKLWSFDPVD